MAWSNSFRIGVPYNLLRSSRMMGGSLLPNPCLDMPMFVIPCMVCWIDSLLKQLTEGGAHIAEGV